MSLRQPKFKAGYHTIKELEKMGFAILKVEQHNNWAVCKYAAGLASGAVKIRMNPVGSVG